MAHPAHLDGLIDLLVEAVLRDLETPIENAPAAAVEGIATEAWSSRDEAYPKTTPTQV
jgi:hypothetical protein